MGLLVLIILLILVFGLPFGGYRGWYGPAYGWSGSGLFLIILIILLISAPWGPWYR